jgi:hypothetical protein
VDNSFRAFAFLSLLIFCACQKSDTPTEEKGLELSAPEPRSAPISAPLNASATTYTNEMQTERLRQEAEVLGIDKLHPPTNAPDAQEDTRPLISYQEGLERTREYTKQFKKQRLEIDRHKQKSVTLPGETPQILVGKESGHPIPSANAAKEPRE